VVASEPVCRAGVCGVRGFCDSESDLCGDVDGVCGVMGNGTANSSGVRFAETRWLSGDLEGEVPAYFARSLVSEEGLLVDAKVGRSARGNVGMDLAAWSW
jgi:hypothetical protein